MNQSLKGALGPVRYFSEYTVMEDESLRSWGDLAPENVTVSLLADGSSPKRWYVPELLSGSDYSGGSVNKSNFRVFLKKYPEDGTHIVRLFGGYGTYGVAIAEEALEKLPVLDEAVAAHVELPPGA